MKLYHGTTAELNFDFEKLLFKENYNNGFESFMIGTKN